MTLGNGDVLDIWSDGGSGNMIYGAAVANTAQILDYQDPYPGNQAWTALRVPADANLTFTAVPEPSTWAMMALGSRGSAPRATVHRANPPPEHEDFADEKPLSGRLFC